MLGYDPHPGQLEIHKSDAPRRIVACGVRWGKTTCAAMEGLAAALQPRERSIGWVVGPTYDLADRVYREIQLVALKHLRHRIITMKEAERRLILSNLGGGVSEIRAKSADNPVSLLGEGLDWLVIDEFARLKPMVWQNHLSPRLLDKQGWCLTISTPRGKGLFHELYMRGQHGEPGWESWSYPSQTNPLLDPALIEEERKHLPERVFAQEYLAQWIEGAGAVFRNVRECATGELEEPKKGAIYYGGLDLAKVEDFTVLVLLDRERRVVHVDRFNQIDWALQVERVRAAQQRFDGARILVDSTGAGEPVYENLRSAGCDVQGYSLTARSKADLINNLALLLEQRKIVLPRPQLAPHLIDELESCEFSVSDAGNVRSGAPSGMHDDTVIALALAAWQVREQAFRVPRVGVMRRDTGQIRWYGPAAKGGA
jgi:hypothetical protein